MFAISTTTAFTSDITYYSSTIIIIKNYLNDTLSTYLEKENCAIKQWYKYNRTYFQECGIDHK